MQNVQKCKSPIIIKPNTRPFFLICAGMLLCDNFDHETYECKLGCKFILDEKCATEGKK